MLWSLLKSLLLMWTWESSMSTASSMRCTTELFMAAMVKTPAKTPTAMAEITVMLRVRLRQTFFQAMDAIIKVLFTPLGRL